MADKKLLRSFLVAKLRRYAPEGMEVSMIEAKNIFYKVRKGRDFFCMDDVSLKLEEGYITCLLGNNGAGKTTLMNIMYGMIVPGSGEIRYKGKRVTKKNLDIYHDEVVYCDGNWCIPHMTVSQNMEFFSPLYPDFDRQQFDEILTRLQADGLVDKTYETLSAGEQKKIELAYGMARNPRFWFLDEPFANLDPVIKTEVQDLMIFAARKKGTGIFLSTHLVDEISDMVDFIAVIEEGKIKEFGDREQIFEKYETENLRDVVKA